MKNIKLITLITGAMALWVAPKIDAQTCRGPQPSICDRACWGARSGSCTTTMTLTRAIIHHTAGNEYNTTGLADSKAYVRAIQNMDMDVDGWCDIGYHFMVDKFGNIFECRKNSISGSPRGAHDSDNSGSFGFTFMGYFHAPRNNAPTTAMLNAMYALIAWKMPSGWSPYGSGTYHSKTVGVVDGHRKVVATACPGDLIHPVYITENYSGGAMRNGIASRRSCAPPPTTVIVDNSSAGFSVVGTSWASGSSSTDKYGSDYRYHSTEAISEPAQWTATLGTTKTYAVSAWWPQGSNRSTTAAYHITHAGGTTVVNVNQQANGGKWNALGSWSMNAGSNHVQLSCWTATGFIVVADAIQWQ